MKIAGALFGFLILAVVFVFWYRAYKSIKGDDSSLFPAGRDKKKQNNSLDEFIASYKRGEVDVAAATPLAPPPAAPRTAPPAAVGTVAAPSAASAPGAPVKREAFVSGSTKLAYLACKAGLRDHHIFAHVQLSALSAGGAIDPALARSGVDLLICNAAMAAVAAVDMIDAGDGATYAAKSDFLKALGIRYLRLSAKSLPRPDELHSLLYRM